jgi:hypothetical protein
VSDCRLQEIRERLNQIVRCHGDDQWAARQDGLKLAVGHDKTPYLALSGFVSVAEFIAAARSDVPWLLERVAELTSERDRAREIAVALEQEVAHLTERLRPPRDDGQASSLQPMPDPYRLGSLPAAEFVFEDPL